MPAIYAPAVLLGERPPLGGLLAYTVAAVLALTAAGAYARTSAFDRVAPLCDRVAPALVAAAAIAFAFVSYSLSRAAVVDFDPAMSQLGLFTQSSWTALHGYPFSNTHESIDGSLVSHFAVHFSPTLLLFQPVMKAWPSPLTLAACQAVCAALAVVPLYVLLRRHTTPGAAAVLAVAYLGLPAIAMSGHHDFHDADFLPVFLFAAAAALDARRRGWFTLFAVLALGVREDASLVVAMLGVYSLLARRDVLGGAWAIVLGVAWGVVVTKLVMPLFWTPGLWIDPARFLVLHLGHLGATPAAIAAHIAHDPVGFARLLVNGDNVKYLYALVRPMLALPLAGSLAWLPAVPALLVNMLTRQGWLRDPLEYYAIVPVAFAYLATALTAARLAGSTPARRGASRGGAAPSPEAGRAAWPTRRPALALATATMVLAGVIPALPLVPRGLPPARPPAAPARSLMEAIPADVPIYVPVGLYAPMATRHNVGCWESLGPLGRTPAMRGRFEYVVLWPRPVTAGDDPRDAALADSLAGDPRFRRLGGYDPFIVYHRTAPRAMQGSR